MSIIVKLNNKNLPSTQIKVYRSTERIDIENLPEPIATLAGDAQEFLEPEHLKYDTDYYYVVEVIGEHGSSFSPNRKYRLGVDVGPGPKELIAGDEELGLFGVFRAWDYEREIVEMFSPLYGASGLTSTRIVKYIRKGKVYFMRVDPNYSASPRNIREAGMLYSPDSAMRVGGDAYQTLLDQFPPVIRRSGNYKFYIRCATLDNEDHDLQLNTTDIHLVDTPAGKSEIIDLLRIIHNFGLQIPRKKRPFQVGGYRVGSNTTYAVPDAFNASYHVNINVTSSQTVTTSQNGISTTSTSGVLWLPIVEYAGVAVDDETIFDPPAIEQPEEPEPEVPEEPGSEEQQPAGE